MMLCFAPLHHLALTSRRGRHLHRGEHSTGGRNALCERLLEWSVIHKVNYSVYHCCFSFFKFALSQADALRRSFEKFQDEIT